MVSVFLCLCLVCVAQQETPPASPPTPDFLVVIDAAHGGDDRGAALNDHLSEKDVALALARRLYQQLEARGIASRLLRDSDSALSIEQRAIATNSALAGVARGDRSVRVSSKARAKGAGFFITLHASEVGSGVRVFTSTLPPADVNSVFLPWDTAQSAYVSSSELLAATIRTELSKRNIPAVSMAVSLQPLDQIASPALALEIAPPGRGRLEEINSPGYQQSVCAALADAIAAARERLTH